MRRELLPLAAFVALVGCVVLGTGCGFGAMADFRPPCTSDDQCGAEQVCFPDGCGDPGKDIRVEVTPNVAQGYYAQDIAIPDDIGPTLNLDVPSPSQIAGRVDRKATGVAPSTNYLYNGTVTVTATGESELIPGLKRRFTSTVSVTSVDADNYSYRVPVASGMFNVSVASADTSVPPGDDLNVSVQPGTTAVAYFVFAASSEVLAVDGRLVRTGSIPVQAAEMEVQAFDPTGKPLSQRVPASSGQVGSTGDFRLFLAPEYKDFSEFNIVATPKDPAAMVPSKKFTVRSTSALSSPLELGDYGAAIDVKGVVAGADGQPITGATVYLDGPVNGDGQFKTQRALTDANGTFLVRTLPTKTGSQTTLWVIPPAKSTSGIVRKMVVVDDTKKDLGMVSCAAKPILTGKVLLPENEPKPAVAVRVIAEPISADNGGVLPPPGAETMTDEEGNFSLPLDPALYRLDFVPTTVNLPRASRLMSIKLATGQAIDDVKLSNALTVTGTVLGRTVATNRDLVQPVPYAGVRFFRLITLEGGKKSSVLLAESVADAQGKYQVTLPTR